MAKIQLVGFLFYKITKLIIIFLGCIGKGFLIFWFYAFKNYKQIPKNVYYYFVNFNNKNSDLIEVSCTILLSYTTVKKIINS